MSMKNTIQLLQEKLMHTAIIRSLVTFFFCLPTLASAAATLSIHSEWGFTSPSNPVVIGFYLYQEGIRVCQVDDGSARAMDCMVTLTEPTTQFSLTATYNDGSESPPSPPVTYSIPNKVQQLYIGYLARAADQDGLNYWVGEIIAGTLTLEQLCINLSEQQEYESIY